MANPNNPDSADAGKAAHTGWTAHPRDGLYPEWEIEEAVNAGVRPDGVRVLADVIATVYGEGDIARERAVLIAAAPETKRQRDMLLRVVNGAVKAIDGRCGGGARGGYIDREDDEYHAMRAAIAECEGAA